MITSWIRKTYPVNQVNLSWHAAYPFTGNLSSAADWNRLLNEVTTLKSTESAPASLVYYALIPISNGTSTWFSSGIAGIGWVGSRTSVGLNTSSSASQIAAHEIGHNMGMWHTPCGNPSGVDPNYPYPDGSIGQVGLDITSGTLYNPGSFRDMMTYCNPKWISDYTYKTIYQAQVQYSAGAELPLAAPNQRPAGQRSLLLRAQLGPGWRRPFTCLCAPWPAGQST